MRRGLPARFIHSEHRGDRGVALNIGRETDERPGDTPPRAPTGLGPGCTGSAQGPSHNLAMWSNIVRETRVQSQGQRQWTESAKCSR